MAITTYTFPEQETLAGTLAFTVKTSSGAGGTVTTAADNGIKYFSSEFNVVNEVEIAGGDIASSYCDVTIDQDVDSLFRSTIFASLEEDDGYVTISVSLNGTVLFFGIIEPSTINIQASHSVYSNDYTENSRITFRCVWILNLLKFISKSELVAELISSGLNYTKIRYYYSVTIAKLLHVIFDLFETQFSITQQLTISPTINVRMFGKGDGERTGNPAALYNFPTAIDSGLVDDCGLSETSSPSLLFYYSAPDGTDKVGLFKDYGVASTIFGDVDNSGGDFDNCYDLFIGIIKSLALYADIKHSNDYEVVVNIINRVSGSEIIIEDSLSLQEVPMSELSRSGANITSASAGHKFDEDFNVSIGDSKYSYTSLIDFGDDNDHPGVANIGGVLTPYNSIKSLVYPITNSPTYAGTTAGNGDYYALIRCIGVGDNLLQNPTFDSDLSHWSVAFGNWSYSTTDIGFGAGSARVEMFDSTSPKIIYQDVTIDRLANDGYIWGGWFNALGTNVNLIGTRVTFTIETVDAVGIWSETKTINQKNQTFLLYTVLERSFARRLASNNIPYRFGITITPYALSTATNYVYMDRMFLYRARRSSPELIGAIIQDYFSARLSRRSLTVNNVRSDYNVGDFFYDSAGSKFYLRKIAMNISENETEIEAINYPY